MNQRGNIEGGQLPTLVRSDNGKGFLSSMPFVIRVCRACVFFPVALAGGLYISILVFVILNPSLQIPLLPRVLMTSVFAAIVVYAVFNTFVSGLVVLVADNVGLYYPVRGNKRVYSLISWRAVKEIDVYDDGSVRKLRIATTLSHEVAVLQPCHGEAIVNRQWSLLFYPGFSMNIHKYASHLNELKSVGYA